MTHCTCDRDTGPRDEPCPVHVETVAADPIRERMLEARAALTGHEAVVVEMVGRIDCSCGWVGPTAGTYQVGPWFAHASSAIANAKPPGRRT